MPRPRSLESRGLARGARRGGWSGGGGAGWVAGVMSVAVATMIAGCGPVEYLAQVSGRATAALAQAQREGGDVQAPYEFTLATEYLRKAREDAGRSQYQTSLEYGRKAEELANRALAAAREKAARRAHEYEDPGAAEQPRRPGRSMPRSEP